MVEKRLRRYIPATFELVVIPMVMLAWARQFTAPFGAQTLGPSGLS